MKTDDTDKQNASNDKPMADQSLTTGSENDAQTAGTNTDAAVDDIMKRESDELLKVQDQASKDVVVMKQSIWDRIKGAFADWWDNPRQRYGTIGFIVLLFGVLFGVPYLRYNILGVAAAAPVSVTVLDSKTGKPVSGATVSSNGKQAKTEANGKAQLTIHTGSRTIKVTKPYYKGATVTKLVGLSASANSYQVKVNAEGRSIQVQVTDKVSGANVPEAVIAIGSTTTKTDAKGMATVVVSASVDKQDVTITAPGYSPVKVALLVADGKPQAVAVVPAGKLYFLSNLSGKINVVKTNLDGTDRQVVLEGTGSEDSQTTSLLASRDWKYLALLSKREGKPKVYLIDTTNGDKLVTVDEGDADFSFVGWSGSNFVYQVGRNSVANWQPNKYALKAYNAETGQNLLLDQTQASGTNDYDALWQSFSTVTLVGDQVVYGKGWQAGGASYNQIPSKQAELHTIGSNGAGHKVVKSFSIDSGAAQQYSVNINTRLYGPNNLYIEFWNNSKPQYFSYQAGKVTELTDMTQDRYYALNYPTYLQSPNGSQVFWAELRDGKNTLFTGDQDAKSPKQIASLSSYTSYGWYTDKYLLVSKGGSELYIMSATGGNPVKITDYYKPAVNYQGYGGGYGGL